MHSATVWSQDGKGNDLTSPLTPKVLAVGESTVWRAPSNCAVFVRDSHVLKVQPVSANRVRLEARKKGATVAKSCGQKLSVVVLPEESFVEWLKVHSILPQMVGLKAQWNGTQLHLIGRLHRWRDWRFFHHTFRHLPWRMSAVPDSEVWERSRSHFQKILIQASLSTEARWRLPRGPKDSAKPITLELPQSAISPQSTEDNQIKARFQRWGIQVKRNRHVLALAPRIRSSLVVVDLSRSSQKELGLDWPSSHKIKILPEPPQSAPLITQIKGLQGKGKARLLASTSLLTESGSTGEFHSGGEFAVRVSGFQGQHVEWKEYGLKVHLKPRADIRKQIHFESRIEVSAVDPSQTIEGVPGLKKKTVTNKFSLDSGEIHLMAHLSRQQDNQNRSQIPGVASLPLLGSLFKSHHHQSQVQNVFLLLQAEVIP